MGHTVYKTLSRRNSEDSSLAWLYIAAHIDDVDPQLGNRPLDKRIGPPD
jgi:hypothetical protein